VDPDESGTRVTNPLRVMLDVGAVVSLGELEDVLDRGLSKRLFSVAAAEWAYNELAKPGRRGCGRIRRVLDERALGADPPDGLLEPRMARLLRDHGLPPAAFQHRVAGVGRVDFAYPELMIVIEVDGYGYHASPSAAARDYEQHNLLPDAGMAGLRVHLGAGRTPSGRRGRRHQGGAGCMMSLGQSEGVGLDGKVAGVVAAQHADCQLTVGD
jgi:hypothetical protein